ncbi:MAG: binding 4 protein [Chloroflexi bacterium]|nr:binding 4 protein [Chloroflexota bacterium]
MSHRCHPFSGSIPEKVWNIRLAAERLNGVVVPPGGVFSFNNEVGRTTLESGFKWGYGIASGQDGVHTIPSVAGGICQVATTLFHPVFWAGYPLEERYWHLYWIPAYTSRGVVGLDVTVDEDSNLDFKWINPTDDYVLIQTSTDSDTIYVSLYGKKPAWKVETLAPVMANRVPPDPKPMAEAEPTLPWGRTVAVQAARDGFDVTVTRRVIPAGDGEPRTLNLRSRYAPAQTLTLVGTAGIPAGASVEEALGRILDPQGAAQNRPAVQATPTGPEQSGTPPQTGATAVIAATPGSTPGSTPGPTSQPVTPTTPPTSAPTATVRPAP